MVKIHAEFWSIKGPSAPNNRGSGVGPYSHHLMTHLSQFPPPSGIGELRQKYKRKVMAVYKMDEFMNKADINLIYDALQLLENYLYDHAEKEGALDTDRMGRIERIREQLHKHTQYKPKDERRIVEI